MVEAPVDILGTTWSELERFVRRRVARGAGLAPQIYRSAMKDGRFAPEDHGMSGEAVRAWRAAFTVGLLPVVRTVEEPSSLGGQTVKAVMRTFDGLEVECVRIPMGAGKFTLCVSSQVGCKMGCKFCETGLMGLLRNLSTAEIVGQLVTARSVLGWDIKNVVFMGMGEPLDNPDHVIAALRVMNERRGLAFGQQRFTVCTVGRPDGIRRLAELGWKRLNVSLSLNAAEDELRSSIMPVNRKHSLSEVQAALLAYPRRANFVYGINYCLLPGINDRAQDARLVADFCRPLERVALNLIPYNPGSVPIARAPSEEETESFIGRLEAEGLFVRRRATKGRSVMAACGQLGNPGLRAAHKRALA